MSRHVDKTQETNALCKQCNRLFHYKYNSRYVRLLCNDCREMRQCITYDNTIPRVRNRELEDRAREIKISLECDNSFENAVRLIEDE
jgi:hypothetical protein